MTPALLGLGLDEISTSPLMLPEIKKIIRSMTYEEGREIVKKILEFSQGTEVVEFLKKKYEEISERPEARR